MKLFPWVGVLSTLLLISFWAKNSEAQLASNDEVLAKMRDAFDAPAADLAPAVVVMPSVDAANRIRADGFGFSQAVNFSMVYGPHRRMTVSVPLVQEMLYASDCWQSGTVLTDEKLRACLMLLGAPCYAVPRFSASNDGYDVVVEFHGRAGEIPDAEFDLHIQQDEYGKAAGMIARTVLQHVGVELSPQEDALLDRSLIRSEEASIQLNQLLGNSNGELESLVLRNPSCVVGWECYLNHAQNGPKAIQQFRAQQQSLPCDRLEISVAIRERKFGRPLSAMATLLEMAPSHHGDTYYYLTLAKTGMLLADDRIMEAILSAWRNAGNEYADRYYRATILKDWAWQARGEDLAVNVRPEAWETFHARLNLALDELEQAAVVNPQACAPHAEMIYVATGLGLPYDFVDEHFATALKIRPDYAQAYFAKLSYLRPLWFGTPERLIPFAKQCLESGLWQERVPQLFVQALDYAYKDRYEGTFSVEPFRSDEMWGLIKSYYRGALEHGTPEDQRLATNYFALWGSLGQRSAELSQEFQRIGYHQDVYDQDVFPDRADFLLMWDRVREQTDVDFGSLGPKVRVALSEGRFDDVTQLLDNAKPNYFYETALVQHYRRVEALGRELRETRQLQFSGLHIKHAFDGIGESISHSLLGEVRSGKYVWNATPPRRYEVRMVFPVSFRRGKLSGLLRFDPGIQYVGVSFRLHSGQSPASIRYYPQTSKLQLVEGRWTRDEAALSAAELRFAITIGEQGDSIEVNDKISMQLDKTPIQPGTFAIHVFADPEQGGQFEIEELALKLED